MRVEQRIGRVDRIGQPHVVRAINFVLGDTVEHRVREVLETKLAIIAEEFGVDKASDVMDSVGAEPLFDDLFIHALQKPETIEAECEAAVAQMRSTIMETQKNSELLGDCHDLDQDGARQWRDHPAQFWLERAITTGLPAKGGEAIKEGDAWHLRWGDGSESAPVCFDARTAEDRPEIAWLTLEDPRARAVISDLPRCVAGQPIPNVRIVGLPDTVRGVWSLWDISLAAEDFSRRRFMPVFINEEGRTFLPTAKRIWDLLLTESLALVGLPTILDSERWFDISSLAAASQGERLFSDLAEAHRMRLQEERQRALYAYEARTNAIGRIGLQNVRTHRRNRLQVDYETRLAQLANSEDYLPDLQPVLMLRVGAGMVEAS